MKARFFMLAQIHNSQIDTSQILLIHSLRDIVIYLAQHQSWWRSLQILASPIDFSVVFLCHILHYKVT